MTEINNTQEFVEGQIFEDIYPPEAASWCNSNQKFFIKEIDGIKKKVNEEFSEYDENGTEIKKTRKVIKNLRRFQIVAIPEPTVEELQSRKRAERDNILKTVTDPVMMNSVRWEELSDEEQKTWKAYRRYLLDFPSQDNWWTLPILSFNDWKAAQ